jgi:hypothetical protein
LTNNNQMGYSVFIRVKAAESRKLKKIFHDYADNPLFDFQIRGPLWDEEDLSYGDDKGGLVFGFDYGEHYAANAFVNWAALKCKKKTYCYDGLEKIKVTESHWWSKPKEQLDEYERLTICHLEEYFVKLDLAIKELNNRWDTFK